jgi:hypothetical protein
MLLRWRKMGILIFSRADATHNEQAAERLVFCMLNKIM